MNRSTATAITLIAPLLLYVAFRDQVFEAWERWRNRPPCERVLGESEIRAATGGRTRGPEVSLTDGRCVADWGAAVVTLRAYTPHTEKFEDVLASVRERQGFMTSSDLAGTPPVAIAELQGRIGDERRTTKVILVDRGAGGWAELALHFDGDAIAGPGRAPLDALIARVRQRLADKETALAPRNRGF